MGYQEPKRIRPRGQADLEVLTKVVFQSGMSWRVIEAKWDGFRQAFHGFDAETVAGLSPPEIDALAADTRIVRNRRKIEATVENAATMLELDRQHGGFRRYLRSHGDFEAVAGDLVKRFRYLGGLGPTTSCTWWARRSRRTRSGWPSIGRRASRSRPGRHDGPEAPAARVRPAGGRSRG